jgi:methylase of polypeptide subunit release factors
LSTFKKAHLIGQKYEKSLTSGKRRDFKEREGIFYTPANLSKYTVGKCFRYWQQLRPHSQPHLTILDPACGGGAFLIEAAEYMSSERLGSNLSISLCGIDKDQNAVAAAEDALAFYTPDFSVRISPGNSLISKTPDTNIDSLAPVDWSQNFPEAMSQGGFDLIIANPPYGISRGDKFHPLEKKIIEERYDWIRKGKVNKYIAFTGLAYELLKPGGVAGLIIPNSWLGIDSGQKMREFLLDDSRILEVVILPKDAFDEPSVETVLLLIHKPAAPKSTSQNFKISHLNNLKEPFLESTEEVSFDEPKSLPGKIISVNRSVAGSKALKIIFENSFRLGDEKSMFIPKIAIQAYAVGKGSPPQSEADVKNRVFDTEDGSAPGALPYLDSKDIKPLRVAWSGRYLKYGPWLAEPQILERFMGPRLVLREILGKESNPIIAAFTNEPFLYNKSVLHILPKTGNTSADDMLALLGILSSNVATLVIKTLGRKSQRKLFPKLVLADLKDFPVPLGFLEAKTTLAKLTQELIQNKQDGKTDNLIVAKKLNEMVSSLYGLSETPSIN